MAASRSASRSKSCRTGAQIVVGTPGRVLDHLARGTLDLTSCSSSCSTKPTGCSTSASGPTSSGFCSRCPHARQTLLLVAPRCRRRSPSWPQRYMRDPRDAQLLAQGHLGRDDRAVLFHGRSASGSSTCSLQLLEREQPQQAIIFCRTKRGTDKIYQRLSKKLDRRGLHPRRHDPDGPRPRDGRVSRRQGRVSGGHRRRRPRHRRDAASRTSSTTTSRSSATTTSTASAAPAAWAAKAWPTRSSRPTKATS